MAGLNRIKFSKYPLQECKLNFFVDYYNYFVHFAGVLSTLELENPLSIVDKLIFQLENNHKNEQCVTYVKNYLRKLVAYPKKYQGNFISYQNVIIIFEEWKNNGFKYNYLKTRYDEFIDHLKNLRLQLNKKMIRNAVDSLKHYILCECSIKRHSKQIVFYTQILASELILLRGSKGEATELFSDIMTKDFKRFPYPTEVTTEDEKKEYFERKTIKETLDAMYDFSKMSPVVWDVNFKVDRMIMPPDYVFKFGDVCVYPAGHSEKRSMEEKVNQSEDDMLEAFFKGNYAIIEVMVTASTYQGAYRSAINKLNYLVDYLEQILKKTVIVNRSNYLFSTDKINYGYSFRGLVENINITEIDIMRLEDNAYEVLRSYPTVAAAEFLVLKECTLMHEGNMTSLDCGNIWRYY